MPKGFQDKRYRRVIEALIDERRKRGLSQSAFAKIIGTHQQFVSRYETGERRLDVIEFVDVAAQLGVDPLRVISEALDD